MRRYAFLCAIVSFLYTTPAFPQQPFPTPQSTLMDRVYSSIQIGAHKAYTWLQAAYKGRLSTRTLLSTLEKGCGVVEKTCTVWGWSDLLSKAFGHTTWQETAKKAYETSTISALVAPLFLPFEVNYTLFWGHLIPELDLQAAWTAWGQEGFGGEKMRNLSTQVLDCMAFFGPKASQKMQAACLDPGSWWHTPTTWWYKAWLPAGFQEWHKPLATLKNWPWPLIIQSAAKASLTSRFSPLKWVKSELVQKVATEAIVTGGLIGLAWTTYGVITPLEVAYAAHTIGQCIKLVTEEQPKGIKSSRGIQEDSEG